jgi:hypothetical protein
MSIKEIPTPQREIDFPVARKSKSSPLTVLFTTRSQGLVIKAGENFKYGQFFKDWSDFDDDTV